MGERPDEITRRGQPDEDHNPFAVVQPEMESDSTPREKGSPEEIRAEIERTRAEMSGTIDAIQERLNPDSLKERAREAVREATIGRAEETMSNMVGRAEEMVNDAGETARETSSSMMETIKQNPIPAMLAGIGLGWLFMNRAPARRTYPRYGAGRSGYPYERTGYAYEGLRGGFEGEEPGGIGEKIGETASQAQERAGEMVGSAGEAARGAGSGVMETIRENPLPSALVGLGLGWLLVNRSSEGEMPYGYRSRRGPYYGSYEESERGKVSEFRGKAGEAAERAQETAGQAVEQVQETAGQVVEQVQERAGDIARRTQYQARRVEDRFQEMLSSNPLGVGTAALALGALAAFALPETERERELMGEARENLMQQARTTAEETVQKVQRVAEEAQNESQEEERRRGMTG